MRQCTKMRQVYTRTHVFFSPTLKRKFVDKNGPFNLGGATLTPILPSKKHAYVCTRGAFWCAGALFFNVLRAVNYQKQNLKIKSLVRWRTVLYVLRTIN